MAIMRRGARRPSVSAAALVIGAGSLLMAACSPSASASPFLTVTLLGSVHGSGDPYSSRVFVQTGDTIDYVIQVQLAVQGATNANAPSAYQTITQWKPSKGANELTSGLQNVSFSLTQTATAGTIQSNFTSSLTGTTTGGGTWGAGTGSMFGTRVNRGNGNRDLRSIALMREAGNFDGIANDLSPELLTIANGSFKIASTGTTTTLDISFIGYPDPSIVACFRWFDPSDSSTRNYNAVTNSQSASVANGDPLIVLNGLTLSPAGSAPEPGTFGTLAISTSVAVMSSARQWRRCARRLD